MFYRQQDKKEDDENNQNVYDLDDLTIVKMSEQIDYILNKENNKETRAKVDLPGKITKIY